MSLKNKDTLRLQENAKHTAGSRSFAIVQDQQEILLKRKVSRAELYCLTHTDKDGNPVDTYCSTKIEKFKKGLDANPALLGEVAHKEDLYSTQFPKAKTSSRHGLGLVVGGKTSENIYQLKEENKELRRMVQDLKDDMLVQSETMEYKCSQIVEQRCNEMMLMFKASLNQNSTQEATYTQPEFHPTGGKEHAVDNTKEEHPTGEEEHEVDKTKEAQTKRSRKRKKLNELTTTVKEEEASKSAVEEEETCKAPDTAMQASRKSTPSKRMRAPPNSATARRNQEMKQKEVSKETVAHEDRDNQVVNEKQKRKNKKEEEEIKIHKVKVEKAEANIASSKIAAQKTEITAGMEVTLRSPNSLTMAATTTVLNDDPNDVGSDGKPLTEYVDVLVNYVLTGETSLPRPNGRINKLGNAQARCIPWPRIYVNKRTESEVVHEKIWRSLEQNLVPKEGVIQLQSQHQDSEKKNRKRSTTDGIVTANSPIKRVLVLSGSRRQPH